jgi:hypothetical protein
MAVIGDTHRSSEVSPFQRADMTAIAGNCMQDLARADPVGARRRRLRCSP